MRVCSGAACETGNCFISRYLRMQVPGMDVDGVFGILLALPHQQPPRTENRTYPRPASAGLLVLHCTGDSHTKYIIHRLLLVYNITHRAKQIGWPHFHVLFNIDFGGIWYPSTAVGFGSVYTFFFLLGRLPGVRQLANFAVIIGHGILKKTSIWAGNGISPAKWNIDSGTEWRSIPQLTELRFLFRNLRNGWESIAAILGY